MKKALLLLSLALILVNINSCKNDLDAMAPYKESIAVFGLIDPTDTVNYIRVNRVFLGVGDANQIAQIQDSVYFKPGEANVIVEKYWNGNLRQTYKFSETYEKPLEPGVFNTNQLIYKSTQKFKSDSLNRVFEYVLKVTNLKTGTVFESEKINLIKDVAASPNTNCGALGADCFFQDPNSSVSITAFQTVNGPVKTEVMFVTPKYCSITSFNLKFFYHDVLLNSTNSNKVFAMDFGFQTTENANGGSTMDYSFPGVTFFNALNNFVKDDPNVNYRMADSMKFYFYFGGDEYKLYREINNTSGTFGQEKPIYTNMKNGAVGIFSSRAKIVVTKKMFDCSVGVFQPGIISKRFFEDLSSSLYPYCRMKFNGPGAGSGGTCPIYTGC